MVMVRDQIYPLRVFDESSGALFTVESIEKYAIDYFDSIVYNLIVGNCGRL